MSALIIESAPADLYARAQALDAHLREARRQQRRRNHRLATLLREMDDDRLHERQRARQAEGADERSPASAKAGLVANLSRSDKP